MCSPYAALGVQTATDWLGQSSTAKAAQQAMNQQAKAAITEMNFNIQNLEQERTDAFDNAVAEISNTRLNSLQLNSQVKAAVSETMSGRTAGLIVRATEGDTARAVSSIQENYQRKSNEIDLNREQVVNSTHAYLENLNASAPKMPSRLTNFMTFAGNALNAYASAQSSKTVQNGGSTGGNFKYTYTDNLKSHSMQSYTTTTAANASNQQWSTYKLKY